MVFEVVWTQKAVKSYIANIQYLEKFWSKKESDNFKLLTDNAIKLLKKLSRDWCFKSKRKKNRSTFIGYSQTGHAHLPNAF